MKIYGRAQDRRDLWHVAEHEIAEHHRPDDHRILIRHHHACRRELQRTIDAQQRAHRNAPRCGKENETAGARHNPPEWRQQRAEQERAGELRRRQHDIGCCPQRAGDQHQHRKRQAAAERNHRRPAHRLRRRAQRDQHAAETDQDRAPAPPADALAQHDRRQRGDENRAGQIIGDDVGERQIDGGEKKRRDFEGGERHPEQLQPRPLKVNELRAVPPDHRQQHDQRRAGAQQKQLSNRIGRDEELSHRVAEREHEYRQQHQADAGETRRALVFKGRDFREQVHVWPRHRIMLFVMAGSVPAIHVSYAALF